MIMRKAAKFTLALALSASMLPQTAFAKEAEVSHVTQQAEVSDVTQQQEEVAYASSVQAEPDYSWYTQNSSSDTFYIDSPAALLGLSALVNGTSGLGASVDFAGKTIEQTVGLSLYSYNSQSQEFEPMDFSPIGAKDTPFNGTFDGKGNSITGMTLNSAKSNTGLFGYAGEGSCIRNVWLAEDDDRPNVIEFHATAFVENVGSVVGYTLGNLENCVSATNITIESSAPLDPLSKSALRVVGGIAGYSCGDIAECEYSGLLSCKISTAAATSSTSNDELQVADSFGGIVGRFGEPGKYGTISNSKNDGNLWVRAIGSGGTDNFGQSTYARSLFVGGVCGYSNGSIVECSNGTHTSYGMTGTVSTSAEDKIDGQATGNVGADQIGGIVGGIRSTSNVSGKYNDGDPNHPVTVDNCRNYGQVTGCVSVGGIVGETGAYVTITKCANGAPSDSSETQRYITSTRWNKPMTGGIVGRVFGGTVSHCANYWPVSNVQLGYYVAGVCGALWGSDDHPNLIAELYSCINTGQIRTDNQDPTAEYREAGIVGTNEGYIHDCVMLDGTVPFHSDQIVGSANQGNVSNCKVMSFEEMQSSECAALLNTKASLDSNWDVYWFVNGFGYPVLNVWIDDAYIKMIDLSEVFDSASLISNACFAGSDNCPAPKISVTLKDGNNLVQDTDFYVIPQEGANAITSEGETPYMASIAGLGRYTGQVSNCVAYGIDKGSLSGSNITVADATYAFGRQVYPKSVEVGIGNSVLSSSEFSYVIYDGTTALENGVLPSNPFKAFDSLGYIQIDGEQKKSVSDVGDLNAITKHFVLFDRFGEQISDSDGNIYYATNTNRGGVAGTVNVSRKGCVELKKGTPSGYLVQVLPSDQSGSLEGEGFGYFVVNSLNLARECQVDVIECQGQKWYWDADTASLYTRDSQGNKVSGTPSAIFTGDPIRPTVSMSYGDYKLVEGKDFSLIFGDPDPSDIESGATDESSSEANRNVTSKTSRAAVTIRPVDTNKLSSYIIAYFDIAPAKLENCTVNIDNSICSFTGQEIKPVTLSLNGKKLIEGVDYKIVYKNNVNGGTASYTITPLANLAGGQSSKTGTFAIQQVGISGADVALSATSSVYSGMPFKPTINSVKLSGQTLAVNKDYTVSYLDASKNAVASPVNAGTYYVRVTGKGSYAGTKDVAFTITPAPISSMKLSATSFKWTGKALAPKVTVYASVGGGSVALLSNAASGNASVTVSMPSAKNVGKYTVKATGTGNYQGSASATFKVNPKGTTISKLTKLKRGFTVKWKKQASQTTGYEIRYSLKKTMASSKTIVVSKAKTVSKKKTGLKSKKTYYVQIRTYKKVGGVKYVSAWSSKKSVKTK